MSEDESTGQPPDTPPLLRIPETLLNPSVIYIGGTSNARSQYLSELFPGTEIIAAETADEPNDKGVLGVVEYKLGQALKRAVKTNTKPPGRLLVASDIMVSRLRIQNEGENGSKLILQENIGKYDSIETIYQDLQEMADLAGQNISPVYFIHAGSGILWESNKPEFEQHDFRITLKTEKLAEMIQRESFDEYVGNMNALLGEDGALRVAGGLELGYLLQRGAVESIEGIVSGSEIFGQAAAEAIHYAQIGIDPFLFADLGKTV